MLLENVRMAMKKHLLMCTKNMAFCHVLNFKNWTPDSYSDSRFNQRLEKPPGTSFMQFRALFKKCCRHFEFPKSDIKLVVSVLENPWVPSRSLKNLIGYNLSATGSSKYKYLRNMNGSLENAKSTQKLMLAAIRRRTRLVRKV